jgi:hypothetical protein
MRWSRRREQDARIAESGGRPEDTSGGRPEDGPEVRDRAQRAEGRRSDEGRSGEGARRDGARPRRRLGLRTRDAGAAAVGTLGTGVLALARAVRVVAGLIVLLIALAIVLRDVDANQANTIVKGVHEGANFFAGAFTGLIAFSGHPKRAITVNWGIALVVYLVVGALLASMIARIGRGGVRFERRHRVAPTP